MTSSLVNLSMVTTEPTSWLQAFANQQLLTPSPSSPYRAHRVNTQPRQQRPKPYQRPGGELKNHTQQLLSSGSASPFSPITPISLTSSSSSGSFPSLCRSRSALPTTFGQPSAGATGQTLTVPSRNLQRTESAPALVPFGINNASSSTLTARHAQGSHTTQPQQQQQSSEGITVPIFAANSGSTSSGSGGAAASSPLVFSTEYIEAQLAKHGNNVFGPCGSASAGPQSATLNASGLEYQDTDLLTLLSLDGESLLRTTTTTDFNSNTFPYASAYVTPVSTASFPQHSVKGVQYIPTSGAPKIDGKAALPEPSESRAARLAEEEKRQKYAVDLIEAAIKTIYKIWPETQEPDHVSHVGPVTSDGRLRPTYGGQQNPSPSKLRRRPSQQQLTPDSSPDQSYRAGSTKRKHPGVTEEVREIDGHDAAITKKRVLEEVTRDGRVAIDATPRSASPNVAKHQAPAGHSQQQPSSSHQITLRIFVRELLRRSKTSCNTLEVAMCYLDGIEETVRKLRDCLKLGITFGTVAMAERGPYDEGMKDEGRIIKLDEWRAQQLSQAEEDGMDIRGDWPHQPEDTTLASPVSPWDLKHTKMTLGKPSTSVPPSQPASHVLATHPLLDARRTFLAALVLATKFIQDKAYSNKAWAKLSGLSGKEVGRCERALGGALQWRLWVGKDIGTGTSIRGRTPVDEVDSICSGESETVVYGDNDPIAKAFMEQALEQQALLEKAKVEARMAEVMGGLSCDPTTGSAASVSAPMAAHQQPLVPVATARAECGRSRTWPLLDIEAANATASLLAQCSSRPPLTATSSCASLAEQLASVALQQPASLASHLSVVWPQLPPSGGMQLPATSSSICSIPLSHSPIGVDDGEDIIESILRSTECPTVLTTPATVRMTMDEVPETPSRTPVLRMTSSFTNNEPSPPPGFLEAFQSGTFPFTFSTGQMVMQHPSKSGSWPLPPVPKLLHPQTAALRASAGVGSSTSPNSVSTFSSPEVLTPINSRSSTLSTLVGDVEVNAYWKTDVSSHGHEFQRCVDKLYGGVVQRIQTFQAVQ